MSEINNPAEIASQRALDEIYQCFDAWSSFCLEAGAGAGKTYSLVKSLKYLIVRHQYSMSRRNQRIACITFTNVAKDEILARTDRNPLIFCETIHSFCWSLISGFQNQLRSLISEMPTWHDRILTVGNLGERTVEYSLGYRSIREQQICIHHDDVIQLTIRLMEYPKFRHIMVNLYPIILIDEYQDTDSQWIEAIKLYFLGKDNSPLFGFYGDHWQKIYGKGCGKIEHPAVKYIGKEANFRSVSTIVNVLNRMRPELPQFIVNPTERGSISVFHSNNWRGERQSSSHWKGDLPSNIRHFAFERVKSILSEEGWDFSPEKSKILMLTHRILANEQGYASLPDLFSFSESYTAKEHPYIEYFVDKLEPACDAYDEHKFGLMFEVLDARVPLIRNRNDKIAWATAMDDLMRLREHDTVGAVLDHLSATNRPKLPDNIKKLEHDLATFDRSNDNIMPDTLAEIEKLRLVRYSEIKALRAYHSGFSPFETNHGVKGAEFENVLVVVGRGWNRYNFGKMLEMALQPQIITKNLEMFERNRNLFYVACSRAKYRLALLFTQELTQMALDTLIKWFGNDNIKSLDFTTQI